jgi:hypothetical protein
MRCQFFSHCTRPSGTHAALRWLVAEGAQATFLVPGTHPAEPRIAEKEAITRGRLLAVQEGSACDGFLNSPYAISVLAFKI